MIDHWGIADGFHDVRGQWVPAAQGTIAALREAMGDPEPGPPLWFVEVGGEHDLLGECRITLEDGTPHHGGAPLQRLPADLPLGYHRLEPTDGGPVTQLVVHPARCPAPAPGWGVAAQTYALWSSRTWGVGDLRDLGDLAARVAAAGGSYVLVSPLHAPAPTAGADPSPYYPSTRRAISPVLIPMADPPPPDLRCTPDALIDRDRAWAAKRRVLESQFGRARWDDEWRTWALHQGDDLWMVARWATIADDFGPDWRTWPASLAHPGDPTFDHRAAADPAVAERLEFHAWCQWLAHQDLRTAGGHGAGIIGDLAVGFSPLGADAWQFQDVIARGVSVGAPPDVFNPSGQDWGLPGLAPWRLRAAGYAPFISTLRACLRGVAGLRIDHVMGLFRQYWVPAGGSPTDGAYVTFPAHELLAIIALEAARAGAFVIGEDLGTVQPEVREAMERWGVLGTKVVLFEDRPPADYPEMALATVTTHDLPTAVGLLAGRGDERLRDRLVEVAGSAHDDPADRVIDRVHAQLLASPARIRLLTTDDLTGAVEQPNVPGTLSPTNWCRRLPVPVEQIHIPRHG